MACADPNTVSGATLTTTSPYADGSLAVFQCTSGYVMDGTPFITCTTGAWVGTYPTCNKQDTNSVSVSNTDTNNTNLDSLPDWLAYVIAAVCGVLILLILLCIFVWCCQLLGCYEGGGLFGRFTGGERSCCDCCRKRGYDPEHQPYERRCKVYPRKYEYDENGRRYHYDDYGRRCYYQHRNRHNTTKVTTVSSHVNEYPPSEHDSRMNGVVTSSDIDTTERTDKKPVAKELHTWKPHVHHVRSINTSTK